MSAGQELKTGTAAADDHPLLTALRVRAELWPFPGTDAGGEDPAFTPVIALFGDDAFLERMLARQQASTHGLDRKGAAAFLVTEYGSLFALTVVPSFVGFGLVPDAAPARYALSFAAPSGAEAGARRPDVAVRFLSRRFTTSDPRHASHPDARRLVDREGLCAALREEIELHFAPLVERLHGLTHLSRAGAWRLVGDAVAARFLEAGERLGCSGDAISAALAVLKDRGSPLNNRQMHFFDIAVRDGEGAILTKKTFRQRGGCCRLYTADERAMCVTCVLRDPAERDAIIVSAMRRKLGLAADAAPPGHLPS